MTDDSDGGGPRWRTMIGLLAIVVCLLLGVFVWHKVAQMGALQDCVASGRRDCLQVPTSN
jgi:hypothetical protein